MATATKSKEGCASILFTFAMVPVIVLANAFAARALWTWFVVPLGAPAIGMAHAYGLTALASVMSPKSYTKVDERKDHPLAVIVAIGLLAPALMYFSGYLAHWVMT